MGKRSTSSFHRRAMDAYATPYEAVPPLIPFLIAHRVRTFAEPCAGDGDLVRHLESLDLTCSYSGDIRSGQDALRLTAGQLAGVDAIISNPPWTRSILHPLIEHFIRLAPTWLLFDADWAHCRQAVPYLDHCSHIVSVGRVKWMPDSAFTGKDNAAWYRFDANHRYGVMFYGRASNQIEKSYVAPIGEQAA